MSFDAGGGLKREREEKDSELGECRSQNVLAFIGCYCGG